MENPLRPGSSSTGLSFGEGLYCLDLGISMFRRIMALTLSSILVGSGSCAHVQTGEVCSANDAFVHVHLGDCDDVGRRVDDSEVHREPGEESRRNLPIGVRTTSDHDDVLIIGTLNDVVQAGPKSALRPRLCVAILWTASLDASSRFSTGILLITFGASNSACPLYLRNLAILI